MPNPGMPQQPSHDHLSVIDGLWRVHVSYVNGHGYTAQFERWRDAQWQPIGPIAASRRSEIYALARLSEGYRRFAEALERRWSFNDAGRLLGGCPRCGYTHIRLTEDDGRACWRCIACSRSGSKPL